MIYRLFGFDDILLDLKTVLDLRVHLSISCEMNLIKIIYLKWVCDSQLISKLDINILFKQVLFSMIFANVVYHTLTSIWKKKIYLFMDGDKLFFNSNNLYYLKKNVVHYLVTQPFMLQRKWNTRIYSVYYS